MIERALVCGTLVLSLSASSCGWTMAEPIDVMQISDELPIKDRSSWSGSLANESFGLGPYKVANVDRKWNSTRSSSFLGFESSRTKGGYSYEVVSGGTQLKGECATEDRGNTEQLGQGMELGNLIAKLGCRCSDEAGAVSLMLEGSTDTDFSGAVTGPDLEYTITAIMQRNKGPASRDPLGYRIDGKSAPIGAADLKRPGRVWISKAVTGTQHAQVACLFAGLMLYLPPQER